jgi:hypothetical protein
MSKIYTSSDFGYSFLLQCVLYLQEVTKVVYDFVTYTKTVSNFSRTKTADNDLRICFQIL